jgi:hypothetical protein
MGVGLSRRNEACERKRARETCRAQKGPPSQGGGCSSAFRRIDVGTRGGDLVMMIRRRAVRVHVRRLPFTPKFEPGAAAALECPQVDCTRPLSRMDYMRRGIRGSTVFAR